jgi:hypothetical protein
MKREKGEKERENWIRGQWEGGRRKGIGRRRRKEKRK